MYLGALSVFHSVPSTIASAASLGVPEICQTMGPIGGYRDIYASMASGLRRGMLSP